eukprot:TRINITY_DN34382_c0_g1_i1.p1 TRINITY_DN34382_c0_g1~~TRINITY_DN34382_c0_g1_i1.p1  ORF type:complete len:179 (+),score=28.86 TRINITY_DN34382_c0_g1_i1:75-611(+)
MAADRCLSPCSNAGGAEGRSQERRIPSVPARRRRPSVSGADGVLDPRKIVSDDRPRRAPDSGASAAEIVVHHRPRRNSRQEGTAGQGRRSSKLPSNRDGYTEDAAAPAAAAASHAAGPHQAQGGERPAGRRSSKNPPGAKAKTAAKEQEAPRTHDELLQELENRPRIVNSWWGKLVSA